MERRRVNEYISNIRDTDRSLIELLKEYNRLKNTLSERFEIRDSSFTFLNNKKQGVVNKILTIEENINDRDSDGKTALIHLCSSPFHIRFYDADKTIFDFLIKKNADINIKDNEGKSALMYALSIDYFTTKETNDGEEGLSHSEDYGAYHAIIRLKEGINEDIAIWLMNQSTLNLNEIVFDIIIRKIKNTLEITKFISQHLRHLVKLIKLFNYSEEIIENILKKWNDFPKAMPSFFIRYSPNYGETPEETMTVDKLRAFIMSTKSKTGDFILHCLTLSESESKSELGESESKSELGDFNKVTDWKNMFSKIYEYIDNDTFLNCSEGFCIYNNKNICENCGNILLRPEIPKPKDDDSF